MKQIWILMINVTLITPAKCYFVYISVDNMMTSYVELRETLEQQTTSE